MLAAPVHCPFTVLGRYIPTIFHGDVAAAHRLPKESTPSYQNDSPVSCQSSHPGS